ncbi:hypothetical protein HanXRQr2_Chr13g0582401 [Helianthus annuus]|uniref:Uncharacterized protein n=1 Tax=Helianthus annuus TaxID=4232 RepID=A0A9K3EGZ3_HELAN|nr:hypothetical protein HanXRQr2_Chr13g0582401 [Helianthus annuus]
MDLAGVGISSHVKYKDVIHGFWVWPVCLNPGRDTSSKLGLQLLSFDESLANFYTIYTVCKT